jgi:predicted kinase
MADLYVMAGCPGSGKSTCLKNNVDPKTAKIISRDEIRFSIVKPEENYFSHEDEVLNIFWKRINEALKEGKDVFVDQTSLTPKSRKFLLRHVTGYTYANCIWVKASLKTCLNRNEMRKGTRAYVPRDVIRRMSEQFVEPSLNEGFDYIFCYDSEENKITYKGSIA